MDVSLRVNSVRKQMLPVAVQVEFMQLTFFRDVWPSSRVTTFGRERLQQCNHLHYNRPKSLTYYYFSYILFDLLRRLNSSKINHILTHTL